MDEKAILLPSIEYNKIAQPIDSCSVMGLLFWNFVDILKCLTPSLQNCIRHHNPNPKINNSFDRN